MIQLSTVLYIFIIAFAMVGAMRGWSRELVVTAALVLALFLLEQGRQIFVGPFQSLFGSGITQTFWFNAIIIGLLAFFGYQSPSYATRYSNLRFNRRNNSSELLLGAVFGAINGYLLFGSLWYYMDAASYPLSPMIIAPSLGSPSAAMLASLPPPLLLSSGLLNVVVIILFVIVIVAII